MTGWAFEDAAPRCCSSTIAGTFFSSAASTARSPTCLHGGSPLVAVEAGETPEDAAIREVFEETGLVVDDPGPIVFTRTFTWEFEGTEYDQEEWFFLVRTPTFEPDATRWTVTESATFRGHRWWSIDELRSTARPSSLKTSRTKWSASSPTDEQAGHARGSLARRDSGRPICRAARGYLGVLPNFVCPWISGKPARPPGAPRVVEMARGRSTKSAPI